MEWICCALDDRKERKDRDTNTLMATWGVYDSDNYSLTSVAVCMVIADIFSHHPLLPIMKSP